MRPAGCPDRRLAAALLLCGLVLCGRLALAAHPYEHDLADWSGGDCEICDVALLPGDGPSSDEVTGAHAAQGSLELPAPRAPVLLRRWNPRLSQGPPAPSL